MLLVAVLSSGFYYVEATKWAMNAKSWALAGLVLGPLLLPMFSMSRHVALRQSAGFNNLYFQA